MMKIAFVSDEDGIHNDHGLTPAHHVFMNGHVEKQTGFFMLSLALPEDMESVPCGLYGPTSGDAIITDAECEGFVRGERRWMDRTVDKEYRPARFLVVIGIVSDDDNSDHSAGRKSATIFTAYGSMDGTIAPQAPDDPNCTDVAVSTEFWGGHALTRRPVSSWAL